MTIACHYILLKNTNIDLEVAKIESLVKEQLRKSEKLIPANLEFVNELDRIINDPSHASQYSALKLNIYKGDTLLFWNNPEIIDSSISQSDFIQIDKGQTYTIIRDLNLFNEQGLISDQLINQAKAEYQFTQTVESKSTHEFVLNGIPIFLEKGFPIKAKWKSVLCLLLLFCTTLLFLFGHNLFSKRVLNSSRSINGLLASLGILLLARFGLEQIDFHQFYILEQVFNPVNNFSNFHKSVGGMFWNSSFFFAGSLLFNSFKTSTRPSDFSRIIYCSISLLIPVATLIGFIYISRGLIFETDIIIDNNQVISFDKHSLLELLSLMLVLLSAFFLHFTAAERMKRWEMNWKERSISNLLALAISIPLYITFVDYPSLWIFYFTISAFYLVQDLFVDNKIKNLPWAIWWVVLYAGFTAALIFGLSFQKRIAERSNYLDHVHIDNKNHVNLEVDLTKKAIKSSGIIEKISSLPYPAKFEKPDILEYLKGNLSSDELKYLDSNIEVYIYDGYANSYFVNDFTREDQLINTISTSNQISPNVYYSPFKQIYILSFFIENNNYPGNRLRIYFEARPANIKAIAPVDTDYIVLQNNRALQQRNTKDVNFTKFINFTEGQYFLDRKSILIKEKTNGVKIISVERIANLLKPISLFSFFFLFLSILLFGLTLINSAYTVLPEGLNLKFKKANSLRSRLQLMVIALIIISFLFIGFVSFYYFKNILESNQNQEFVRDLDKIQKDIYATNKDALDDQGSLIILSNSLLELSEIHNVDISLYDRNATLINSINPKKKPNVNFEAAQLFVMNSGLSSTSTFNAKEYSSFIALKRLSPMIYGFIEINHRSTDIITDRLKEFINTILNLYVFLFLLAGAIAISVANSITYPLTVLSEKLKQTKLGRKNELLQWDSRDEIGVLIQEYNSMISKLEESATLLAKTERDHAWKEMAKQVAHEVKNPLTPMKLSVQSLDRAIKANPENAEGIIKKTTNTLIEQIDTLTEIANSFANLAKMPKASKERLLINQLVENVHDLFEGRNDFEFQLILPMDDMSIYADRNQLIRIFNNLIKNAIQSISPHRKGKIVMELSKKDQQALIRISDNGIGIPEETRKKIFTPNFTTKSTGTGLGLAMCANMIETLNGKIYFESEVDTGTDFYVEIPLIKDV